MTMVTTSWQNLDSFSNTIPKHYADWLLQCPKLSPIFKKYCQQLTLQRLTQNWHTCFKDEAQALSLTLQHSSLIREILLLGDGVAWSFGRVVIPPHTYQHWPDKFDQLDTHPIGESLLYSNNTVTRSPFSYTKLTATNPLYQRINNTQTCISNELWARRSIFMIAANKPLLITDVLLPNIPKYNTHD